MPYVSDERKKQLLTYEAGELTPGDLNYAISMTAIEYLKTKPKISYALLNEVWGAMTLAAEEFKRRMIDPYEDKKIGENGDIYPPELLKQVSPFNLEELERMMADVEPELEENCS